MKNNLRAVKQIGTSSAIFISMTLSSNTTIAKQQVSSNPNESELALIHNINTACESLAFQSNDPVAIAKKFGIATPSNENSQKVIPFNKDLDSIYVETNHTVSSYPAYSIEFKLRTTAPIFVKSLEQSFGSYRLMPRLRYFSNLAFDVPSKKILPKTCNIFVTYISDSRGIKYSKMTEITVRL
jgi:hypothetical protein